MIKKKRKKKKKHARSRLVRNVPAARTPVKPEILAPAGTWEAFDAALSAGADAVYVGMGSLNARALAGNFSIEDIAALTDTAHEHGRKLFVAMNSLIKEEEIPAAAEALAAIDEAGVDAAIIQDLGVWRMAKTHFPGLRLHASTLMTLHNSSGVLQAEKMGFSRVVLAREMTMKEIRAAAGATTVELEVFIHGAMCFTYSGMCMFSSFFGGRSSTRGRCVQPCRRRYQWAGRKGTFFSMDDLNGLEFVHALSSAGICSLKIEGRLKPPHYVESVVRAYRILLDLPEDAGEKQRKDAVEEAERLISQSLGRPGSPGYFMSPAPSGAVSPTRAAGTGQYMGKVTAIRGNCIMVSGKIMPEKGDRLRLVNRWKDEQRAFNCRGAEAADAGNQYEITVPQEWDVQTGNLLFRTDVSLQRRRRRGGRAGHAHTLPPGFHKRIRNRSREILEEIGYGNASNARFRSENRGKRHGPVNKNRHSSPLWIKTRSLSQLSMASGINSDGVIMTINESNVRSLNSRRGEIFQDREVVWALPPIVQEERLALYRRLVISLMKQGYRNFQAANLAHLHLLQDIRVRGVRRKRTPQQRGPDINAGRMDIFGNYTLNLLNSQAVRAALDLGVSRPQLAVETDAKNAAMVLDSVSAPLSFTIFAWLPLFTSRLDHSSYAHGRPVSSMRDEMFYWQRGNGAHVLLADKPFSLIKYRRELEAMGFSALIIDMSNWPAARKIKKRRGHDVNIMDVLKRGREFNFSGVLL